MRIKNSKKVKSKMNDNNEVYVSSSGFTAKAVKYEENKEALWEIRRKDNTDVLGIIFFGEADEYEVITAKLDFTSDLEVKEYIDLLSVVFDEVMK